MSRHRKSDPHWRTSAAGEVMAACVPELGLHGRVLLAGEAEAPLREAVRAAGGEPDVWLRRTSGGTAATPWPTDGPFGAALVRLPRAKDELDMMLHAVAARVAAGGPIAIYGANDEGIRSVPARLEPWLGPSRSIAQRAHCRVELFERPDTLADLRPAMRDWVRTSRLAIGGRERDWTSYPGTFAKGGLDDGTRLLLEALDQETAPAPASALDFGCGTGVISAHLLARTPGMTITLADSDALAIAAATHNVPGATAAIVSSLKDLPAARFDLLVSNPPIHDGKAEDYTVLGQLISQAAEHLTPRGRLVFVVQHRVPVAEWLAVAFATVEKIAETSRFTVWRSSHPKKPAAARPVRPPRDRSNAAPGRGR